MRVGVYQFAPVFGEKEANLKKIENVVRMSEADLIVFPELCTTGYQFISHEEVRASAERVPDGPTVERLLHLSREENKFIVLGLAEDQKGLIFNTSVLVGPKGFVGKYRKVHLFFEEKTWFQPGDLGFPVWDIGFTKIGMMICFDWVFPEAARSLTLQGAEIVCHPVNLVLPYCQEAMKTRCIENGIFAVTANRIGTEERGRKKPLTFTGGSQVVDPKGEILFRLGVDEEGYQDVEIDPAMARDKMITEHNHLLDDRKPECYQ